jgi:long-chain acyl-CoA synthetase
MDYLTTDVDKDNNPTPRGEICFRGYNVMTDYYKMAEKTKETVDKKGWLHTGDIGMILPNGALKIIDRKKNLFKLAQGEYVAPEKVENIYNLFPYVDECFVHGDSLQNFCVGVIGVNPPGFKKFAEENQFDTSVSLEELLKNDKLRMCLWKDIYQRGKGHKLHGFEQAKNIQLVNTPF